MAPTEVMAAEPASIVPMSEKDFAAWIIGTEWEYKAGKNVRRLWFVTPELVVYSRPEKGGLEQASGFAWNAVKKGEARFYYDASEKTPYDVTFSTDLKRASVRNVQAKDTFEATMSGRRALPAPPNLSEAEFRAWLPGKVMSTSGALYTFKDGTVHVKWSNKEWTHKTKIIRPGLAYYLHTENVRAPVLMAFSPDLKSMQFWCWWGTKSGSVKDTAPAVVAKTQPVSKNTPVTMPDLKPIRLAGKAAAVNALLIQELGSSKYAGKASALSLSALELEGDKPATIAFNQSVGPMMQKALQEVARFHAIRQGGWPRANEMQLSFEDKFTGKDGPSAAVACALVLESVIKGTELDPAFAVTGDLNADGSVQPIGGVHAKLRGATNLKCTLLGIPQKNAIHAMDIYHTEGLKPFLGIQVFAFTKFDEALAVARLGKPPEIMAAIAEFSTLAKSAAKAPNSLRAPDAMTKLQSIIQRVPTHLSARVLLLFATDKLPKTLSPAGTLAEIDQATGDLETAIRGDLTAKTKLDGGQVAKARSGLQRLRPLADARVRPLVDAWVAWGNLADKFVKNDGPRDEKDVKEWIATVNRIGVEEEKLRTNEGFREELE
jgi:hypothetical protein